MDAFVYNLFRRGCGPLETTPKSPPNPPSTLRQPIANTEAREEMLKAFKRLEAYEVPDPSGTCHFLRLPDEVMVNVFTRLDRRSLTRCFRLNKSIHDLVTSNSSICLHHLLQTQSLRVNPNATALSENTSQIPPSSAFLLNTLRERITRFRNLTPKSTEKYTLMEPEGRLYEYLEGILLRGVGDRFVLPTGLAVYDLRKVGEWTDIPHDDDTGSEDLNTSDNEATESAWATARQTEGSGNTSYVETEEDPDVRTHKKFDFSISDFAVDPGMDLLVVVQTHVTGTGPSRRRTMKIHLLSLSTFEPHPRASTPVLVWPGNNLRSEPSLGFQICDDGLFVLNHSRGPGHDQVCGWQWTTGRLAVTLTAFPTMSFESFVLLTPSSFVIPTVVAHLDPASLVHDRLDDPSDLSFTHHLQLYAFPPFSMVKITPGEPTPPAHTATHIATIDLPLFHVDMNNMPPPRMIIRTDPPPRHTFPTYPIGHPALFSPDPESGAIIMEFMCQHPDPNGDDPHFVLVMMKSTLIKYLPAPTSPLLAQAFPRPAPVVPWETLAPNVRFFGPDLEAASWVCYVYQNRYVTTRTNEERGYMRLYDFDQLRVKQEILAWKHGLDPVSSTSNGSESRNRSNSDGIILVTAETIIPQALPLTTEIRTGRDFPYMYVEKPDLSDIVLIDGERIVGIQNDEVGWSDRREKAFLSIMEF